MNYQNKRDPMKLIYRESGSDEIDRKERRTDAWFFGTVAVICILFVLAAIIGR